MGDTLAGPLVAVRVSGGGVTLLYMLTVPEEVKMTSEKLMTEVVIGGMTMVVTTVEDTYIVDVAMDPSIVTGVVATGQISVIVVTSGVTGIVV